MEGTQPPEVAVALPPFCPVLSSPVVFSESLINAGTCVASWRVQPGCALDSASTPLKMRKDGARYRGGTAAQTPSYAQSPIALPAPCWPPILVSLAPRLLAHPHLLFGLPSWPPLQPVAWLLPCGLALWQDSWLTRHLRDCWFLWLGSLNPASSLPGFRPSTEPRHCFWKHPNSSCQLPGEMFLTKARLSYN